MAHRILSRTRKWRKPSGRVFEYIIRWNALDTCDANAHARKFESNLMALVVGILPSVTAHKGLAGRAKIVKAFEHYLNTNGHEKASLLMKNRYEASAKNGVSATDIAHFEIGVSVAILVNTAPAVFWMLLLAYSHPGLLEDLRNEIGLMMTEQTRNGETVRSLDITSLKTSCPLLTSTFQEVLRFRSMGTSVRQVMQDTVLDNNWLLKKDCMIEIPSRVIHTDKSIWGSDVDEFNPRRFMKDEPQKTQDGRRPNATAFRAFGGGTTLCPGRHFATNQILAVATMCIMRYDMRPTTGEWSLPDTQNNSVLATTVVMEPDTDVQVEISRRKGFEDGQWAFDLKDLNMVSAVVAEDRAE